MLENTVDIDSERYIASESNGAMNQVIFSCIYGHKHIPLVYSFIYSALEVCPKVKIIIGYSDFSKFELNLLQIAFPAVDFVELSSSTTQLNSHASRASMKIRMWNELYIGYLSVGKFGAFLDIDTVLLKHPFEELSHVGQLFLTRKRGKWPLNTGVVFARKCNEVLQVFSEWEKVTISILGSSKINREAELLGGGADQYALIKILGISESIRDESISSLISDRFGVHVEFVPCAIYNQTESMPLDKNIKIVHYKAGWHKILLQNAPYTKNRPKNSSSEMHALWQATYFKANRILYENLNIEAWYDKKLVQTVASINYEFRGIYNSELVLITSLFKSLGISKILESGRARGHSTYVISKVLHEDAEFYMASVDFTRDQDNLFAEERLKDTASIDLLYGDSNIILSKIALSERIGIADDYGVVLDGPKGLNAIYLSIKLIRSNHPPKIIFIHDMRKLEKGKWSFHRYICSVIFDRVFFSDEFPVTPEILATDKSVFEFIEPDQLTAIQPFQKANFYTGSYGPTLAIIIPSQRDTHILKRFMMMPFNRMLFFFKQLVSFQVSSILRGFNLR